MQVNFNTLRAFCDKPKFANSVEFRKDFQGFDSFEYMQKSFAGFEHAGFEHANKATFKTTLSVAGFAPNVPAYLNNEPENMFNYDHSEANNLIELNIYISISYSISSAEIKKQGQILAKFLQDNTTAKDRFKVSFFNKATHNEFIVGRKNAPIKNSDFEITICDYSDYVTPELLAIICSPAMYRYYILGAKDLNCGFDTRKIIGKPVYFNDLPNKSNYINFMDMANELNKIKIS